MQLIWSSESGPGSGMLHSGSFRSCSPCTPGNISLETSGILTELWIVMSESLGWNPPIEVVPVAYVDATKEAVPQSAASISNCVAILSVPESLLSLEEVEFRRGLCGRHDLWIRSLQPTPCIDKALHASMKVLFLLSSLLVLESRTSLARNGVLCAFLSSRRIRCLFSSSCIALVSMSLASIPNGFSISTAMAFKAQRMKTEKKLKMPDQTG
mmetsp:Transcript_65993/g.124859  ORF Transcript_65993/g.124859 Transcript_65993/m.124859 type:complete len:212 (+) Transcript_65993:491-1126(+)